MRRLRSLSLTVLVVLAVASVGIASAAHALVEVKDVSIGQGADGMTVTVRMTGSAPYEARTIDAPTRLVIDLQGATYATSRARWTSGVDPIREVRGSQWKVGVARVVVELSRKVGYRIDGTDQGLVVVLAPSSSAQDAAPARIEAARVSNLASDAPMVAPEFMTVAKVQDPPAPAQPVVAEVEKPSVPARPVAGEAEKPPQPAQPEAAEAKKPPVPKPTEAAEVKAPTAPEQPAAPEVKEPPVSASPVKATTQDGRTVVLHPDGAWKEAVETKSTSRLGARPPGANLLLAGKQIPYGIWIDPHTWSPPDAKRNAAAEYEFVHVKGDGQAMVIPNANSVQPGTWKEIVLENARRVAPDARITREEKITVNGAEVTLLQTTGTAPAGPFVYYGYYYAGKQGAIQVITYTRPDLLEQYLSDFTRFLNGFVLLE